MKVKNIVYFFVSIVSNCYLFFFKLKNRNKKSVFIYTDSRGFEISKKLNRKTPFFSYINYFVKNYKCDVYICPEKHTTIFDFLYLLNSKIRRGKKYDYIISHTGVVDFSPRVIKDVKPILNLKKHKIINVFGEDFYRDILDLKEYSTEYLGEKTSSIITNKTLFKIASKFNEIKNFIWISCNPVDIKWRGNYNRDRPNNINIVNEKSKKLISLLEKNIKVIDFTNWDLNQVHMYTCDNIHMSKKGMDLIRERIKKELLKKNEI